MNQYSEGDFEKALKINNRLSNSQNRKPKSNHVIPVDWQFCGECRCCETLCRKTIALCPIYLSPPTPSPVHNSK